MASLPVDHEGIEIAQLALEVFLEGDEYYHYDENLEYAYPEISEGFSMPLARSLWKLVYRNTWVDDVIDAFFKTSAVDTWKMLHMDTSIPRSSYPQIGGIMCWGNDNGGRAEVVLHVENDGFTAVNLQVSNENCKKLQLVTRNLADGPSRRYVKNVYLGTILAPLYVHDDQQHL